MDKRTDGQKEVKATETSDRFLFRLDSQRKEEFKKCIEDVDASYATVSAMVYRDSQTLRPFLISKKIYLHLQSIVYNLHDIAKTDFVFAFAIENAQERLGTLERIIEEITRKLDIDLPNVKTEMEQLKATINSPAFATISSFVQTMSKNIENYKKNMEKNDLAT